MGDLHSLAIARAVSVPMGASKPLGTG
jgi:hypothetical protein